MPRLLAVIMGGPSPERAISLATGTAMAAALEQRGHAVTTLELTRNLPQQLLALHPECVVLALHGVPGEDGTIQGLLDLLDLPYTGSGVTASALAIDKGLTKHVARGLGIAVARDIVVRTNDPIDVSQRIAEAGLKWPLIVKGNTAGSTLGLMLVHDPTTLPEALIAAFATSPTVLIEERVIGVEITVCRLGEHRLPVPQILSSNELFDYQAKYTAGLARHQFPPDLPPAVLARAEAQAHLLYDTVGCYGCGRVDMIVQADGTPVMLELNTLPGMTELSFVPEAAAKIGLSFADVCELLVELALARPRSMAALTVG